jgi:tRNA A-37 threonylcarbamoyl transferase component Bud32
MPAIKVRKSDPRSGSQASWIAAVRAFRPEATLKRDKTTVVFSGRFADRKAVIKVTNLSSPWDRLREALGLSRLHRQWRGHETLWKVGAATCTPFCLARTEVPGERPQSILALEFIPGHTLLDHIAEQDLPPSREIALAKRLGRLIAQIALAGYRNRDCKLSNLVVVDPRSDLPQIVTLDAEGIRKARFISPTTAAANMIFKAAVEPIGLHIKIRPSLIAAVAIACAKELSREPTHRPPSNSARLLARRLISRATDYFNAHGDPTPSIDPRRPAQHPSDSSAPRANQPSSP